MRSRRSIIAALWTGILLATLLGAVLAALVGCGGGTNVTSTTTTAFFPTTAPAPLELSIVKFASPVSPNASATLQAKTEPGADCTITVYYDSGQSQATGLGPKKADSVGNVSWTWEVDPITAAGTYRVAITASLGGKLGQKDATFIVNP